MIQLYGFISKHIRCVTLNIQEVRQNIVNYGRVNMIQTTKLNVRDNRKQRAVHIG